jgi:glycosyltransferase involved in cell wall biosynthesis
VRAIQSLLPRSVMRVYHAAVVAEWRARERHVRAAGVDLTLISAARWNEGGQLVTCAPGPDTFVVPVRTLGRHPNLFVYNPWPLWKVLHHGPFDLIDIHEEPCSLAAAEVLVLRWIARSSAPVTLYSAQNIFKRYPPPFRWIERRVLRTAAGVHVCNQAAVSILRQKGFLGVIRVLGLGVDIDRFHPAARGESKFGSLRIGYVGRLDEHKGVGVLLDAVAGEPAWSVRIVGDGPSAGALRGKARDLGDQVSFVGFASGEQLPELYRSFDVVIVPSLSTPRWTEQFCRVAVEAMASGVPVIASDSGALPEVLGDAGLLVPPGDSAALRRALNLLASDLDRRIELGRRGRARANRFAWATIAKEQLDFYAALGHE